MEHPSKSRPHRKRGRPSVPELNPEAIDAVCNALRAGAHIQTACAFVGVGHSSLKQWMKKGRDEILRRKTLVEMMSRWEEDDYHCEPDGQEKRTREKRLDEDEKKREPLQPYVDAVGKIEKAIAEAEMHAVAAVSKAALTDWRAAAWLLERRHGRRWSQKMIETELTKLAKDAGEGEPVTWIDVVKKAAEIEQRKSGKQLKAADSSAADIIEIKESEE